MFPWATGILYFLVMLDVLCQGRNYCTVFNRVRDSLTFVYLLGGKDFMKPLLVDCFLKDWNDQMSIDSTKIFPGFEFQESVRGSPV